MTWGDDRALTNRLLRTGHRTIYTSLSHAYTICPQTLTRLFKQQLRWKKGWLVNTRPCPHRPDHRPERRLATLDPGRPRTHRTSALADHPRRRRRRPPLPPNTTTRHAGCPSTSVSPGRASTNSGCDESMSNRASRSASHAGNQAQGNGPADASTAPPASTRKPHRGAASDRVSAVPRTVALSFTRVIGLSARRSEGLAARCVPPAP
jgi:hypothetical protein